MAVYNIFPNKDATIYSRYSCKNTGRDEILEISAKNSLDYLRLNGRELLESSPFYSYDIAASAGEPIPSEDIRRTIISFSDVDLNKAKSLISGSSYSASLNLYLAFAQNLSQEYTLECYALSQSWVMGTGQFANDPENKTGVSWKHIGQCQLSPTWSSAVGTQEFLSVSGGGTWIASTKVTQSFEYISNKDVSLNITPILQQWLTGSISNNGLILKHSSSLEQSTGSFIDLKFFSMDTHTIYPPHIQLKWNDFEYFPSPTRMYIVRNDYVILSENNIGAFKQKAVHKFRIKARDTFPVRQFTTSSVYLSWKYLPEDSFWAIQDVKTEEMIIDFDEQFTKISADVNGNYFNVFMDGLQPERYYKILIKSNIIQTNVGPLALYDNDDALYDALSFYSDDEIRLLPREEIIKDNDIIFKITR